MAHLALFEDLSASALRW